MILSRGVPDNGQACASSEELVGVESAVAGSRCRFQIDAGRAIDDPYLFRAESAVVRHTFSNANSTSGDWGSPGSLMQLHCSKPSWLFPQPNNEETTVSNLEVLELVASSNTRFADDFAGWSTRMHIQSFSSCRVAWRIYSRGEVEGQELLQQPLWPERDVALESDVPSLQPMGISHTCSLQMRYRRLGQLPETSCQIRIFLVVGQIASQLTSVTLSESTKSSSPPTHHSKMSSCWHFLSHAISRLDMLSCMCGTSSTPPSSHVPYICQ